MRTSNHNHNLFKEGKAAETIYDLIRGLASTWKPILGKEFSNS